MELDTGIYEQIINRLFKDKLEIEDLKHYYIGKKPINRENVAVYLSQYLYTLLKQVMAQLPDNDQGVERGIDLTNQIIKKLVQDFNLDSDNLIEKQKEILTAVVDKTRCEYPDVAAYINSITPSTSLTHSTLFTGREMNLCSELRKEILSSDQIYMLVSFIKTSGVNLLYDQLKKATDSGKQLRVITTTYTKATDFKAVKRIASLNNTKVKVSYNSDTDHLHAKSYIFLRKTGFHTAYIGSSNLSEPALREGLEWNIKVTQSELPEIIQKMRNSFEGYWNNDLFEEFTPGKDDEQLRNALDKNYETPIDYSVLDLIKAHDYQENILEKLRIEREVHHHYRNLIVAATGTGKTVIAAFDFKRFREQHPTAHFLFVAHREEILKQSIKTFRQILEDYNFGDLWYGNHEPTSYSQVFASKDILNNRLESLNLPNDYYDYIIIDEVHHIAASSYRKIINNFKPKILLGLTATPERMDGEDITQDFDGHIAAEIRLDTALNNRLLCPFHYYGITDSIDLKEVHWDHGHYDIAELSKIYRQNDSRTSLIFNALQKYLPNLNTVKALCFCVDIEHAKYMAAKFTLAGLKADLLTSENEMERNRLCKALRDGKINYLFVVDMFNEGVDIPDVDTILFLRPTESLTIFLQQLGRGLRKAKGKPYVNILDFVGQCRDEFDYTDRFRAIIGRTSMSIKEELERGFPHTPFGCQIQLEPKAREYILNNINHAIKSFGLKSLVNLVKTWSTKFSLPLTISNFIGIYHVPLEKLYNRHSFHEICYQAGITDHQLPHENELHSAVRNKWLSTDSYTYFTFIEDLCRKGFKIQVNQLSAIEQTQLLMLYYDLYQKAGYFNHLQDMVDELALDNGFMSETIELMEIFKNQCQTLEETDNSNLPNFALKLHGVYTRDQINVAIGTSTLDKKSSCREGVERNRNSKLEAMYVDIIKDREIGDSTNYDDHALSSDLFQWDTQNQISPNSPTGQNYIHSTQTMLLFVREQKKFADDKSRTMGYIYLGKVHYKDYEYKDVSYGKQMQIKWELESPMPASVYDFSKYKSAI